ncbi:interactor protein for cytohesin exchange factors 1 isoform X1 [Tachysurus ichikawai]
MEAVKAFNVELYSLNEYKPPISKAKMTQITKSAIKAIKSKYPLSSSSALQKHAVRIPKDESVICFLFLG